MAALPNETWMVPEDRTAAEHKLSEMFFQVAYPTDEAGAADWPSEVHDLDGKMGPGLFANYMLSQRMAVERDFDKIHKAPKRRGWSSSPLVVNAFYMDGANGLWIPAGILQSPFFDSKNGDARNYGSLGMVLGHEMTHGFDDNGRQYDARGNLHDWWHAESVARFAEKSRCIGDLFSRFAIDGRHVNGNYTMGEDIADSGGLRFFFCVCVTYCMCMCRRSGVARALAISRRSKRGSTACFSVPLSLAPTQTHTHRFSYAAFAKQERSMVDKRIFFTSFAQTWCMVERKKSAVSGAMCVCACVPECASYVIPARFVIIHASLLIQRQRLESSPASTL